MSKYFGIRILISAFIFFFAASGNNAVLAWVSPTLAPPNGNIGAPVNTGATAQYKSGNFGIGTAGAPTQKLEVNGVAQAATFYASTGFSTFDTAVSAGTVEATQFCLGNGTNCLTSGYGNLTVSGDETYAAVGHLGQLRIQGATNSNFELAIGYDTSAANFAFIEANQYGAGFRPIVLNPSGGNVGIGTGTTAPAQKLTVAGTIQSTGFMLTTTPTAGYVLTSDASGVGTWQAGAGGGTTIPAGAVMFFNQAAPCPSGWTELTQARGRYVVGLPSLGTLPGAPGVACTDGTNCRGTALTNLQSREVGQHSHSFSGSAVADHTHSTPALTTGSGGSHSHGDSQASERHINAPGFSGPGALYDGVTGFFYVSDYGTITDTAPAHTHSVPASTTGSGGGFTPSGTISNQGSVAGTNAPYIQLLVCQKQ